MDKWIIQSRKGVFELAILLLISQRPMYGYELTIGLKKSLPLFELAGGAIYPILKRLTKQGLITFYWADSEGGPKRKYYQITQEGKEIVEKRWEDYKSMYSALKNMAGGHHNG
ncbi:DNA-binding PadR family transcriptional regulator [Oikeobacillus pervagus]|uniref:DNA-binding PadR family transcriptional regulator n=1 Tax=Oikeobacillus pervagus TaxID=1325931 RepID=A0AAJ1T1W6_9BACI|nr:PadR family transcriptional regulator [Oikeobacillus pervagus]MDQ0216869.1 DNA-binding PadR family transcriptional regulator [Oikeobacillus pervagus]